MIAELAADVALFLFLVCWLPDRFFIAGRIGRIHLPREPFTMTRTPG